MTSISSIGPRTPRALALALLSVAVAALSGCDGGAPDGVEATPEALTVNTGFIIPTTTLTVNALDDADDGSCNATHCSLREAINAANAVSSTLGFRLVTIAFNLPPSQTLECVPSFPTTHCTLRSFVPPIQVSHDLPPITRAVAIDGTTQPGYAGAPVVELRGPGGPRSVGLILQSNAGAPGTSAIRGLAITGFPTAGVLVESAQNFLAGNYFGIEPSGAARGNRQGIILHGDANHLGNTVATDRNVISGNTESGVVVCRSCLVPGHSGSANGNIIEGNFIGTAVGGKGARANRDGITVFGDGFVGSDSDGAYSGPVATVIGGNGAAHRNVIAGNLAHGLALQNGARDTRVGANFIGVDATGAPLANGAAGVEIDEADRTVLGTLVENGAVVTTGNVISGNAGDGVRISNFTSQPHQTLTSLFGNLIGLDPTGTTDAGNGGNGVAITRPTLGTLQVGKVGAGNTIAFNHGHGVTSEAQTVDNVNVRGNNIFSNVGLGIDLFADGVTTHDVPTNVHGTKTGATTKVDGLFDFPGLFNRTFEIDVFASHTCDPSGSGEGQTYLGTVSVSTTGTATNGSFSVANLPAVTAGDVITVTATQVVSGTALASTTELSVCAPVSGS